MSTLKKDFSMTRTLRCGDAQSVDGRSRRANAQINKGRMDRSPSLVAFVAALAKSARARKLLLSCQCRRANNFYIFPLLRS